MLSKLGQLIFYDRYSVKCLDRSKVKVGDLVVVCPDPQKVSKQLATVREVHEGSVQVVTEDNEVLELPLYALDLPLENWEEAVTRMVRGLQTSDALLQDPCRDAITAGRFVPAGRVWAGLGVDVELTHFNCFVCPNPKDSRKGILTTLEYLVEIMSRGGGVGFNLASLRPEFFPVRGVNGRSSGAVVWGELFSFATNVVHQGGSRRGSLMLMLMDWHPDVLTFVDAKRDMKRLTGANCSVGISDEFMQAVRDDAMWDLVFPDIDADPVRYDQEWDGDLPKWKAKGYPTQVVRSLPAQELWRRIAEAAHASAEPGLHFIGRSNDMANSYYYPEGTCYSTNPCGEQILPPWGICNLGHINLAAHLVGDGVDAPAKIHWDRLAESVQIGVRFLDRLIDVGRTMFPEQHVLKEKERRIGLGTMGLAEMLMRLHIPYGDNPGCVATVESVYAFICTKAYEASVELAKEKGPFPLCDKEKLARSKFIQQLSSELQVQIKEHGLRNVSIITQAPTGCVAPGTLVIAGGALHPIVALGDPDGETWQSIDVDVATDRSTQKATEFYINGRQPVRTLRTARGFALTATSQHQIRVISHGSDGSEAGAYVWRSVGDIEEGDVVCLKRGELGSLEEPVALEVVTTTKRAIAQLPSYMTSKLAELLGYYMGNGYLKDRGGIHLVVGDKDPDLVQYLQDALVHMWKNPHVGVEQKTGCCVLSLTGYHVVRFFGKNGFSKPKGNNGEGAAGAFIPDAVLASGSRCVAAFLRGLFEAAGSVHGGAVSLSTVSGQLAEQVQVALLGLGIVSTVWCQSDRESSLGDRPLYTLRLLNQKEVNLFRERVGFLSARKKQLLQEIPNSSARGDSIAVVALCEEFYTGSRGLPNDVRQQILGRTTNGSLNLDFVRHMCAEYPILCTTRLGELAQMGLFFDTVVGIVEGESDTFDLSVPSTNTYIANGFVSHNSCGSMIGTSTGIEPYPWLEWTRTGRLGTYTEYARPLQDFLAAHGDYYEDPPSWFVSSENLSPTDHVVVQSRIQKYTDSSISKTSNLPSHYTVQDVMDFYTLLYDSGCKGGTVYRDGSRSEQVLSAVPKEVLQEIPKDLLPMPIVTVSEETSREVLPVPTGVYPMAAVSLQTPVGKLSVKLGQDPITKEPFEVWLDVSRSGTTMAADREAIARLISLVLRLDSPIPPSRRIQLIVDQLSGIQGGDPVGFGENKVLSFPDAIAKALVRLSPTSRPSVHPKDICPECHNSTLMRVEGCEKCSECGYSRC